MQPHLQCYLLVHACKPPRQAAHIDVADFVLWTRAPLLPALANRTSPRVIIRHGDLQPKVNVDSFRQRSCSCTLQVCFVPSCWSKLSAQARPLSAAIDTKHAPTAISTPPPRCSLSAHVCIYLPTHRSGCSLSGRTTLVHISHDNRSLCKSIVQQFVGPHAVPARGPHRQRSPGVVRKMELAGNDSGASCNDYGVPSHENKLMLSCWTQRQCPWTHPSTHIQSINAIMLTAAARTRSVLKAPGLQHQNNAGSRSLRTVMMV